MSSWRKFRRATGSARRADSASVDSRRRRLRAPSGPPRHRHDDVPRSSPRASRLATESVKRRCQEEDEERELEIPRREPDAELLLDADDYLKLQQRRLRAGDRRGAARCYLEARKSQLKAHSQSVEKGAPPRVRLVSYSTKRRGRANAPWARRIFDATALDHPAFSASPQNRAAMMMGILPSRRC